jgi:hypothetical protein
MSDDGPQAAADAPISLQLDRAEFNDQGEQQRRCAVCGQPLAGSYYEINGKICCAACHERLTAAFEKRPGPAGFLRAAGAGLGAAVAGAGIYFAVRAATGLEIGLISILVGFMVGKAVHWGSGGRGGGLYQVLAVFLTYLAIVSTYVPMIYAAYRKAYDEKAAGATASLGGANVQPESGRPASAPAPAEGRRSPQALPKPRSFPRAVGLVVALILMVLFAAVIPFTGAVGILGWIIIAVGLFEAWKLNQRPRLSVSGPHALAPGGPSALAAAPAGPTGWRP